MKYSKEIMELLASHPRRWFAMRSIVSYVQTRAPGPERNAVREGIRRVLAALDDSGTLSIRQPRCKRGAGAMYKWRGGAR